MRAMFAGGRGLGLIPADLIHFLAFRPARTATKVTDPMHVETADCTFSVTDSFLWFGTVQTAQCR